MTCHNCSSLCKKFGKFGPQRIQRYRCKQCKRTFSEEHETPKGPLGDMRISLDKAETILKLMLEGVGSFYPANHRRTPKDDLGSARDRGREVRANYE